MARKRLHRRYKRKNRRSSEDRAPRSNPLVWTELAEFVGPGFAGFAATRVLTRFATVQIAKRKPAWAKHAGAIASIGSLAAAWFGAHRVKFLEKYQMPITVGAAIAAVQSLIQLYVPKLGWMISDASSEAQQNQLMAPQTQMQQIAAAKLAPTDENPDWYTYDESYNAGRYAKETSAQAPDGAPPSTPQARKVAAEEDLLADLNLDDSAGAGNMGIFATN